MLDYRNDRRPLIEGIHEIATKTAGLSYLQDKFADGTTGPLKDICPFTAMGTFNRKMKDANRKAIAAELAKLLDVEAQVPESFEGIPPLNNQRSWFFRYAQKRGDGDIDTLWRVFAAAARFLDSDLPEHRAEFVEAYDAATELSGVAWNLSTGFYWAHPWDFATLDSQSRHYITKRLNLQIPISSPQQPCASDGYLKLLEDLKALFNEDSYPVHSFPELSLASWLYKDADTRETQAGSDQLTADPDEEVDQRQEAVQVTPALEPYSVTDVLKDGVLPRRGGDSSAS
ncbi:MAG: hypothetical protein ACXW37_10365 [Nitrospira sp.]